MDRFRFFVVATVLAAIFIAPAALAQTPVNISIISGTGQVTCPQCTLQGYGRQNFDPMIVKVTDANGNPVANATVNWTVTGGYGVVTTAGGSVGSATQTVQSVTDATGMTNASYTLFFPGSGSQVTPYIPSTISAGLANGNTVNFYLSQALANTGSSGNSSVLIQVYNFAPTSNPPCNNCINPGDTLTGNAGSTSTTQFEVQVYAPGSVIGVVPNVSLRLVSNQSSPSISCATGAGADPGAVLTDQNGFATCTAILGPSTGVGSFYALVGGVDPNISGQEPAFFQTGNYTLHVLPGNPGSLSIVSGNAQASSPGQAIPSALVATVGDSAGNPLAGVPVVWTVSPAGAATLSNPSGSSDSNGHVQTSVTLSNSASGPVQIKVALAANANVSATFTETANIQVSGLNIVSGNSQSAVVNNGFALPLVVQLSTSNGVSSNIPVSFSISGPGILTAGTAFTDSTGTAQTGVIAGSVTGTVTVIATVGSFSKTFTLTVIPAGPSITSGSFYNGADFQKGSISPCSIATIVAPGLAPNIQGAVAYDGIGGLPYLLAGDSVTFGGAQAPIYNVANMNGQQQLTLQVPCSVTPGASVPVTVNVNGGSATVNVAVQPASPGLFLTPITSTTSMPVLERPDGSFVNPNNPARRGETLIAYVTGLGPTTPAVATNSVPVPGSNATVQGTVIVGINGNGVSFISASLTQSVVGVYLVAFQVPSSVPSGSSAGFSIGLLPQGSNTVYYSTLGLFPVQ